MCFPENISPGCGIKLLVHQVYILVWVIVLWTLYSNSPVNSSFTDMTSRGKNVLVVHVYQI